MQYVPYLKEVGFDVEIAPFFDSSYLDALYSGGRMTDRLPKYFLRRVRKLFSESDIIWLEKEALPWLPWFVEGAFYCPQRPLVSDYDDAVFHRYDNHRLGFVRALLGQKIDRVMKRSNIVFAGNCYLADRATRAGAGRVEIVPTVLDLMAYQPREISRPDEKLRVGWIGTPESWAGYGAEHVRLWSDIACQNDALFRIVGAKRSDGDPHSFEFFEWSEEAEIDLVQGIDIGVMPLPDTPWARGKCGYKLLQYMACGLPVVASPVGANNKIVEHGVNGFLAETESEWREALTTLLRSPTLRKRMGRAGRRKVEADYSLQIYGPRVAQMLLDLARC
jgi:glycosyltransferase involved in cell wall biosynthesis